MLRITILHAYLCVEWFLFFYFILVNDDNNQIEKTLPNLNKQVLYLNSIYLNSPCSIFEHSTILFQTPIERDMGVE